MAKKAVKEKAKVDLWLRGIAPSDSLRKWFSHETKKWADFKVRYKMELKGGQELLHKIKQADEEKGTVTILFSAKDEEHNNAVVLSAVLRKMEP